MNGKFLNATFMCFVTFNALVALAVPTSYISGEASENESKTYVRAKNTSSRFLAYRDLDRWFARLNGNKALDYGSGLGYSAEFLFNKGFTVEGADINAEMIAQAAQLYPKINFVLVKENKLPFADKMFDLVFSGSVLFEMSDLKKMQEYLEESKRVMKDDGYFIAVTGSAHMHAPGYRSALRSTDFSENNHAVSGSLVKVYLKEIDLTFQDYFWAEQDYRNVFEAAGMPVCSVHYPLGKKEEEYPWIDELEKSPFLLILAAKKCQ